MKSLKTVIIILGLCLSASVPAFVNCCILQPTHNCIKPSKPFSVSSQWEIDMYNNDVIQYKRCIINFVNEQRQAANKHKQAANEAINEWNDFCRY